MDAAAERSLLQWIQTFEGDFGTPGAIIGFEDLADGVFLSRVMHQIDPDYIDLARLSTDASSNWALHASNLKDLVLAIERYYRDELGRACDASQLIDTTRIARDHDAAEIARLVELLLGCAVQCPNRSEYIHPILEMGAAAQASMMHLIENIMQRFHVTSPQSVRRGSRNSFNTDGGESSEELHVQLAHALDRASQMELRLLDLEREKREMTERLENVLADKHAMSEQLHILEEERDKLLSERQSTLTRDNKKIQQIVEGEIHAMSVQLEERNEELSRFKRESGERMMVLENEVRRQADELDISRSKIAQLGKLEASVAKYKKKLEEMNSLRSQVRELETHNAQYLDRVLDLESTIKTIPALKALVEKYKNQVVELETANVEAVSSNQIKEQRVRRLQEELDSALGGKEFLENQVDELRGQIASLQQRGALEAQSAPLGSILGNAVAGGAGAGDSDEGGFVSSTSADVVLGNGSTVALREHIARLERENAELKRGGDNPEQTHLTNELDLALKAKEALQATVYELKQQNDQLMEELDAIRQSVVGSTDAQPARVDRSTSASGFARPSPPKPVPLAVYQVADMEAELARLREQCEGMESMRATVTELTNRLKDKESVINELSEQRSKLENYTKKTLHAVQTKYMVAVSSHRNQVNEKQEQIEFLEKKMKEVRASYSREQALMMSAFYEIGTEMQRRAMMPQNASQAQQPAAWLANKRTEERSKRRQL